MHRCDCNKAAIRRCIASLASRPYGWDGDDALPARPDALAFCDVLFGPDSLLCLAELAMPEVALCQDGVIDVRFEADGRELLLSFATNRVATYIQVYPDGETTISGVIRYDRPQDNEKFVDLLRWIGARA